MYTKAVFKICHTDGEKKEEREIERGGKRKGRGGGREGREEVSHEYSRIAFNKENRATNAVWKNRATAVSS